MKKSTKEILPVVITIFLFVIWVVLCFYMGKFLFDALLLQIFFGLIFGSIVFGGIILIVLGVIVAFGCIYETIKEIME